MPQILLNKSKVIIFNLFKRLLFRSLLLAAEFLKNTLGTVKDGRDMAKL